MSEPQARKLRVTVIGKREGLGLESSYGRGFLSLGCDVDFFDLDAAVLEHIRFARLGSLFHGFVPVEAWTRKANRQLFLHVFKQKPDLLIVAGATPVRAGALAQIKISCPRTLAVLLWPDPLTSLERHTLESLPVWDLVATYSRDSVPLLERLGAPRVCWLPFAIDPEIHPPNVRVSEAERRRYKCEVIFIGGHRPERERGVLRLLDAGVDIKVWGTDLWRRDARFPRRIDSYFQNEALRGEDWVKATRCASVCLNIIDPGNYPAANMRFFENLATGTACVTTPCPELHEIFRDRDAVAYSGEEAMVDTVKELLADERLRDRMARSALELAMASHTYRHRCETLLSKVGLS